MQDNLNLCICSCSKALFCLTWPIHAYFSKSNFFVFLQEMMTVLKQSKLVPDDILANTAVNQYLQKTARICWLMVTQYPPLVLKTDVKAGDKFNLDVFREYRTRGQKIVRPVWPPVYLHTNGPLISKGFADGDGAK